MAKTLEMAAFFAEKAAGYEEHMRAVFGGRRRMREFFRLIAEQINPTMEPEAVLDLGCGTGLELHEIFRRIPNAAVTGIDLCEEMLALLRRRHRRHLARISLIRASFESIELPAAEFTYAVSSMAMHHFPAERKRRIYERIRRALRPGGLYIEGDYVVSPAAEAEHQAAYERIRTEQALDDSLLYHLDLPFTVKRQLQLLEQAGFKEVDVVHRERNWAIFIAGS